MRKENQSLVMVFLDEGGKQYTITIRDPQDGVVLTDVQRIADNIINNKLIIGKLGFLKSLQGAFLVTRRQESLA